jgi:hypothetical protein
LVCLQKFGRSRTAGLAVKGIRTNSSKRLSQIIMDGIGYSRILTAAAE